MWKCLECNETFPRTERTAHRLRHTSSGWVRSAVGTFFQHCTNEDLLLEAIGVLLDTVRDEYPHLLGKEVLDSVKKVRSEKWERVSDA